MRKLNLYYIEYEALLCTSHHKTGIFTDRAIGSISKNSCLVTLGGTGS